MHFKSREPVCSARAGAGSGVRLVELVKGIRDAWLEPPTSCRVMLRTALAVGRVAATRSAELWLLHDSTHCTQPRGEYDATLR